MLNGHRPSAPNDLAIAVKAIRGLIRSHKRLVKLAPHLFDYAAIDHMAREQEARDARNRELALALEKVYASGIKQTVGLKTV